MIKSFLKPLYLDIRNIVIDTIFPIRCLICETEGTLFICGECKNKLMILEHQYCIVCQKLSLMGLTHPKCQSPHTADGLISIFNYHDPCVADILIKGKYSFLPDVYRELGAIISQKIKHNFSHLISNTQNLTPIPLHWTRLNWRGFNQAKILCEKIGNELNFPTVDCLKRKKPTKTQKDLKKEDRIKNISSVFTLSPVFSREEVRGSSFILIDDVTTTGSTLNEAAKVLKKSGAKTVWCLTVARD